MCHMGRDIPASGWRRAETLDDAAAWYRAYEDWWRSLKAGGASVRRGGAA